MKLKPVSIVFFLIILSVSISCKKESDEVTITNLWSFVALERKTTAEFDTIPDNLNISVLFDPLAIVEVESYCNTGTGNYKTRGADLQIENLSMTEKICHTNEPIDWEAVFVFNFERSEYYLIEQESLIILTGGDFHLHFNKAQ